MKIGEDYEKMEFTFMNLELLEPNALLSDTLIAIVALFLAVLVSRKNKQFTTPFFNYWKWLFIVYGVGFFFGGMGHVFFGYFGALGKYYPLIFGLALPMIIEHAMITLLPSEKHKKLMRLSKAKFILAFIALTAVILTVKGDKTLPALLLVPSINSFLGFVLACGVLGMKFGKSITRSFYFLPISVLVLIPAAILQVGKISFHPWFDRNDAGHLLIMTTVILYYLAVEGYRKHLLEKSTS